MKLIVWIPAYAGMTHVLLFVIPLKKGIQSKITF